MRNDDKPPASGREKFNRMHDVTRITPACMRPKPIAAGQICSPNNSLIGKVSGKTAFVDFIEQICKNKLALPIAAPHRGGFDIAARELEYEHG